jgi:plastocyanin
MLRTAAKGVPSRLAALGLLAMLLHVCPPAIAASVAIRVQQPDGKPLVGAVLTLDAESQSLPPAPPVSTVVDQVDLAFVPDVVVVPVGSTILFPNSDAVSHQVYSFSDAHRFQLPLYRGKPYPPERFDQPGLVTLGCNIHDNMLAYVLVTAAPFFGRTDAQGQWSVGSLPDGTYRVRLWHPLLNESGHSLERVVRIDGAERTELSIRLAHALRPAPLTSRPHSWEY